jgi:hypothetical protein
MQKAFVKEIKVGKKNEKEDSQTNNKIGFYNKMNRSKNY